jgi:hypothetical protein
MKQKFSLLRDTQKNILSIKEYAELDKEILSLLCEESYSDEIIRTAIAQSEQDLISAIRTHNMYPPKIYVLKIAEAIRELYTEEDKLSAELYFNDRELFAENIQDSLSSDQDEDTDIEDGDVEAEELLEEDLEDDYNDETNIVKNLKSSIKVSDDDSSDLDSTP